MIALDQRGHGHSDPADDLPWDAFISDLVAFLDHLQIDGPVVLAGNSLGGTVAFRYAARHPEKVRALIVEESPVVEDGDLDFMHQWTGVYPTREALEAKIGERLSWSVEPSFRETPQGWTLSFSPDVFANAKQALNGYFWEDWMATQCPVLLIQGSQSRAVDGTVLQQMAAKRPNTTLATFNAGHVVHHDMPKAFAEAVRSFLAKV